MPEKPSRFPVAVLALCTMLAGGCVSGAGKGPVVMPSVAPGTSGSGAESEQPAAPAQTAAGGSFLVRWFSELGPAGGNDPYTRAHNSLYADDCEDAAAAAARLDEPLRSLYQGAAWACLAGFHGESRRWPQARSAYDRARAHSAELGCVDRGTLIMLRTLVETHDAHPRARFTRSKRAGTRLCATIDAMVPDHGPSAGGFPIRVTGRNLPDTLTIAFGDKEFEVRQENGAATMIAPAQSDGDPRWVTVDITGNGIWLATYRFRYEPSARPDATSHRPTVPTAATAPPGERPDPGPAGPTGAPPSRPGE